MALHIVASGLVGLVSLLHFYILVLEMFLWDTPTGHKAFKLKPDFATSTKVLAANQGLYNGFLAAGLVWSLLSSSFNFELSLFFLSCVAVAGIFGAATANKKIVFIQTVPAVITLLVIWFTTQ